MRLNNKVAIVTGAGRGIGRGIAEVFAQEGAKVVIATLDAFEGEATLESIRKAGGEASFIQTDVSQEWSVKAMVEETILAYGRIDTLVNNAGITVFKSLFDATLEDWNRVIGIDLLGVFLCSKYAALEMKKQGGSIIQISSNHAIATIPDAEMYAAAKGGVNAMTRSMALSLGPYGIRVNAIMPGFTETPQYHEWMKDKAQTGVEAEVLSLHASGHITTPHEIGKLAVYLASDDSRSMTGAELLIDNALSTRLFHSKII
jgi:NAD(P)-dependent dehydrogenase (short-subunit alcohol dehydrogenase family)